MTLVMSITQDIPGMPDSSAQAKREGDLKWEEKSYREGCAYARERAIKRLQEIEEWLFEHHPPSWEVVAFHERTLVTRSGEIRIRRRLYRDEKGEYHFLLDEYLNLPPRQEASPDLHAEIATLTTYVTFEEACEIVKGLTAGVLSKATLHRLLGRTAQAAIEAEERQWRECFEGGKAPPSEEKAVPILYSEADGTWIHLQREEKRHYEMKSAIAYEGWERLSQEEERYRLKGKRFYCHANDAIPFWEGASLEWSRVWDLSRVELVVVGGDGAGWVEERVEERLLPMVMEAGLR